MENASDCEHQTGALLPR